MTAPEAPAVASAAPRPAGALALVQGPAGAGRTRALAARAATAEGDGRPTATVACSPLERDLDHGVLATLVAVLAGHLDALPPPPDLPVGRAAGPDGWDLLVPVASWLAEAAGARPVLLVDDLQWSDAPSRRGLAFLARRLPALGVDLVLSSHPVARPDAATAELAALAGTVEQLRPLTEEQVGALAATELGRPPGPGLAADLHAATAGRPGLVVPVAAALARQGGDGDERAADLLATVGSSAVAPTVHGWLRGASEAARALASTAAVLGPGTPLDVACDLAGLEPEGDTAAGAVTELADLGVLRAPTGAVELPVPLASGALAATVPAPRAGALHRAAASRLEARRAPEAEVVRHLERTPPGPEPDPALGERLRRAARAARCEGAPRRAAALGRRALAEVTDPARRRTLLLDTARAEVLVDRAAAVAHLDEAAALTTGARERGELDGLLVALQLAVDPRWCRARLARIDAAAVTEDVARRLDAHRLLLDLVDPAGRDGSPPGPTPPVGHPSPPPGRAGLGVRTQLAALAYHRALHGAPATEVVELAEAALGDDAADLVPEGGAPFTFAHIALAAADAASVGRRCDQWDAAAERTGSLAVAGAAATHRAALLRSHGHLAEAVRLARRGLRATGRFGLAASSGGRYGTGVLAEILVTRGDFDEAWTLLRDLGGGQASSDLHGPHLARLLLQAEEDDVDGAVDGVLALGRRCRELGWENPSLLPWRLLAAVLLPRRPGGVEQARTLADEELASARRWGAPRALARALWVAGTLEPGDDGMALLAEGCALLEGTPYRHDRAGLLYALGRKQRQAGSRATARATLQGSLALAEGCEGAALARRIRRELAAAGARPRRRSVSGVTALTAQERRVAGLAAAGLSNREIAGEIYLSLRTVEFHLSNAYRKLGVSSRAELPPGLAPPGRG